MPLPQEYRDAAYRQETAEVFIWLLTIVHGMLDEPIRLTTAGGTWNETLNSYTFDAGGETYICAAFEVEPPGQSEDEPQGRLMVPNVDQRIGAAIEEIDGPAVVTMSAVLESDPTIVIGGPFFDLRLQNVSGDAMQVQGDLLWPQLTTAPWPKDRISPRKFRAAFRALS